MVEVEFLEDLCNICAPVMIEGFSSAKQISSKADRHLFTSVDLKINDILYDRLLKVGFHESEIISEENQPETKSSHDKISWIIDPLDGTNEFISGVPEFALSIAYIEAKRPVAGAICNPVKNYRVVGTVECGLFVNSRRKRASQASKILCSRSEYSKGLLTKLESKLKIQPVGSVAYKLSLISGGFARATISYEGKNSWDVAAGVFLAELAGGVVTDLDGEVLQFDEPLRRFENGLICCSTLYNYKALYDTFVGCSNGIRK